MIILISVSSLAFTQLFKLLENAPNVFFEINENFQLNDLKATIVFLLLTSITVYLLKILVKLTLSAFHLSRDAKERYQLTHIYLAMIRDGAITDKEREIIFQALFSRADTGLLKGDSTPAIPGNIVSQIVKNFGS